MKDNIVTSVAKIKKKLFLKEKQKNKEQRV